MVVEKLVEIAPKDEVRRKSCRESKLQFRGLLPGYMSSPEPMGFESPTNGFI